MRTNYDSALRVTSLNRRFVSNLRRNEYCRVFEVNAFLARLRWATPLRIARILLADDHRRLTEMEERFLSTEFEVVGKVGDGQALFDEALRLKPDVIVTDISMPILNGIEAAERLRDSGCKSRIVFLTIHSDAEFVRRCLSAGAFGYVAKPRMASELIPAIREALDGRIFVSRHVAAKQDM